MRDHLVVFINGQRHELGYDDARLTLAEFLRKGQGLVGTKIVCNEGDCGACSVLIGRLDSDRHRMDYQTIDSCILFMHQLDRTHVVTVEGLRESEGLRDGDQLTPIQDAMVQCHGSQCGYCTPGIVVAMHGMIESGDDLQNDSLRYGLSGNLCRCTGYQQILDAGRRVDVDTVKRMEDLYPSDRFVADISALGDAPVTIKAPVTIQDSQTIFIPRSIEQACQWKSANRAAIFINGATDLGVLNNHRRLPSTDRLCLSSVEEFNEITVQDDLLSIDGGSTWSQIEQAVQDLFPPYYDIITRFGSPQIRNSGTLAGNLATGSPIGDSIPFHLVMNSDIHLASDRGRRMIPLNGFYTGYRENLMSDDELIVKITTPLLAADEKLALYKISKRRDMDISTLTLALWVQFNGDRIEKARLAIGGVGPTVIRVPAAEQLLAGSPMLIDTFHQAGDIAVDQITPWSDVRGSATYRLQLIKNLLLKSYHEFSGELSAVG